MGNWGIIVTVLRFQFHVHFPSYLLHIDVLEPILYIDLF